MVKQIDELSTFVSLTVVEYIPFLYKEDFEKFNEGFKDVLRVINQLQKAKLFINTQEPDIYKDKQYGFKFKENE